MDLGILGPGETQQLLRADTVVQLTTPCQGIHHSLLTSASTSTKSSHPHSHLFAADIIYCYKEMYLAIVEIHRRADLTSPLLNIPHHAKQHLITYMT